MRRCLALLRLAGPLALVALGSNAGTAAAAAIDEGPGGPILVVSDASNPFGRYYAEILRAEGLNEFTAADISTVNAATLDDHDVAILGEMPLSGAQAQMLSNWVQSGGNLIAMRPDDELAGLLGLTDTGNALADGYLDVDTSSSPGAGIVGETIQYHGEADLYTPSGADTIATLFSDATTPTANPAVTLRDVGSNGGQAAAFAYDLARSVVYTRQGNPDWEGQERDGIGPIRSDDLFFGDAVFDPEPDWVDLDKVDIPQADEQQRLLANLIGHMNVDRKPLPRFWYLPRSEKAAIVMTGDDHANGGTIGRFDHYRDVLSPPGCSVADWECVRGTSYIYTNTPLTNPQAAAYEADGFEVALHVNTNCDDWTSQAQLDSLYADQLGDFGAKYTSVPAPSTHRIHCIVWSNWTSQPKVELDHGIRFDTNYYYWPGAWVEDRPGMFTGSGMPMRFADLDGSMIDAYQAVTQMTDESGQTYPFTANTLLDRAIGSKGYYGVFTANMHTDSAAHAGSDAIIDSAQDRGVPVVSARQMLEWIDGRNGSSFGALSWNAGTLEFTIEVGAGANGLRAMVPTDSHAGRLTSVERNGVPVATNIEAIKGVEYAFFVAVAGDYEAIYPPDTTPPAAPQITGSDPVSPANDNDPRLKGVAEAGSTVEIHVGDCPSANPTASGSQADFTGAGIAVEVPDDSTTTFRATATDAADNRSACSAPFEYTEQSTSRPGPPASPAGPGAASLADGSVAVEKGRIPLKIACAAGADCEGTAKVTKKKVTLAKKTSFSVPGGQTETVQVKLTGKAKKLLKRERRLGAKVELKTEGGGQALTASGTLKIKRKG